MDDHRVNNQDGNAFADDMLRLCGGGAGQYGLPTDSSALSPYQTLSHQPSLGRLQQQTTLNNTSWPTKRACGGFTGPPVETGATLPYRDTPRPVSFGPTGIPPVSLSRSVTSGARQAQAGLQPSNPLLPINLQPTIPLLSSADSQPKRFSTPGSESTHQMLQAATQSVVPHLVPGGLSPLPQAHLPHGTHQNAPPLPGICAGAGAFELPVPYAQAQAGLTGSPGSFLPQILTPSLPFQNCVLQGPDHAGPAACANEAALLSQPLDSLNSTASKIRSKLVADGDTDAADSDAVADDPAAFLKDDSGNCESPVKADQHHDLHARQPQGLHQQQQPVERHVAEVNAFRESRKTCRSDQSMPDQERQQQQQHEVGHSGSEEYHYAWDGNKAGKDVPDGGSDSVDTFKDGKRSRQDSSEMQGSATDGSPGPSAKKIKAHMDADGEDASHGHKLTEAERRRVRRRATNRESAKRIRDKREEQMTLMSEQVTKLEAHKAGLMSHMQSVEDCCAQLVEQLKALKQKWCATCVENVKLYKKIFELRKALNPGADSSHLAAQLALHEEVRMPAHAESAAAAPESEPVNQVEQPGLR
ncbi:hypothetical protein WJX77_004822 [Trebouxia sp. C0004]